MSLGDTIKEIWPYVSVICTGGLIPFSIWLSRRVERKDINQEKQEERRTLAQESIVPAIGQLQIAVQTGFNEQNKALGAKIDGMKTELLLAIQGEQFKGIKELIRQTQPSNPPFETPPHGIPSSKRASNDD